MRTMGLLLALLLSGCPTNLEPGECAAEPCPGMCLRNVQCVTACGGPVTSCGCCPCAEGSVDVLTCD